MDDSEDWVRLFRETLPELYAYVARRARGDRALAEDVTQEAWLRAVATWRRKGWPDAPLAWLQTTAANLLQNHFRAAERAGRRPFVDVEQLTHAAGADDEASDAGALVADGLAQIPRSEAALLEAFHLNGRSTRELAREHGISERAVEGRLRRARRRLEEILTRRKR